MTTKKVSYSTLLKEAMSDFNTVPTVDVTGPMTKQILSYKGDGELKTTSDVASILERYYFGNGNDKGVSVLGEDDRSDFPEPDRNDVDDVPDDNISKTKNDIEKAVKEADDMEDEEDEEEAATESTDLSEAEEAVIEKLISEMEEEEDDEEDEEDIEEGVREQEEDEDMEEEDEEEIDIDSATNEMGPIGNPKSADEDDIQEAFNIFREEIESDEDEDEDIDSDDIRI